MKMEGMTRFERRTAIALSGIFATRMLGLFMILPVFAIYATTLPGQNEFLTGVAIGVYGLTQAVFQIPMGMLSDRIGRKPVIIGGLVVFALGSLIAAMADDMVLIIIGRAVQGSGAVAAVVMALASDLTREENRVKVMAIIGMSIGFS
ncbi:MAG: MFS transporter, partial [Gammaproteobacteria bacterium]